MVVCLLFGWLVCTSSEQGGGFSSSEVFAAVRAQAARVVTVARTCSWVGFTCAPMCTSMCTILYTITCTIFCTILCTFMNNFCGIFCSLLRAPFCIQLCSLFCTLSLAFFMYNSVTKKCYDSTCKPTSTHFSVMCIFNLMCTMRFTNVCGTDSALDVHFYVLYCGLYLCSFCFVLSAKVCCPPPM